jgi:hypothetical protein
MRQSPRQGNRIFSAVSAIATPALPLAWIVLAAAAAVGLARAQDKTPLAGVWTLNRTASELPREMGFNPDWIAGAGADRGGGSGSGNAGGGGGGRGRRGSGGGGRSAAAPTPFQGRRESYDEAQRLQLLTNEARNPAARLTIVDTPEAVTITNELGQSRTFHPTGREELIQVQAVTIPTTSHREGDRLVVLYHVEQDRDLRYAFSASTNPARLTVELQFLERGNGDKATRVYDPGAATDTTAASEPRTASSAAPGAPPRPSTETFDQRPGAELKGITSVGILVEDLGREAVACGLSHDAIESALSKKLGGGGLTVRRNSDEDTYVYVNIITTSVANGVCVSRYDAYLYTHATARLSYRDQPVLVQASLIHRGGIGSSTVAGHSAAVVRGLEGYIDLFLTQIHDANK